MARGRGRCARDSSGALYAIGVNVRVCPNMESASEHICLFVRNHGGRSVEAVVESWVDGGRATVARMVRWRCVNVEGVVERVYVYTWSRSSRGRVRKVLCFVLGGEVSGECLIALGCG
jgi:hypothetical protein